MHDDRKLSLASCNKTSISQEETTRFLSYETDNQYLNQDMKQTTDQLMCSLNNNASCLWMFVIADEEDLYCTDSLLVL